MANGLHAITADMTKNGTDTVEHASDFLTELNSLNTNIEGLRAIWRGSAADDFYQSYESQANSLKQFQVLLDDLGVAIGKSADILIKTEEENASAGANLFNV